jgi:hypothetical protein
MNHGQITTVTEHAFEQLVQKLLLLGERHWKIEIVDLKNKTIYQTCLFIILGSRVIVWFRSSKKRSFRFSNNKRSKKYAFRAFSIKRCASCIVYSCVCNTFLRNSIGFAHNLAASLFNGLSLLGSVKMSKISKPPNKLCNDSKIVWTLNTADHLSYLVNIFKSP